MRSTAKTNRNAVVKQGKQHQSLPFTAMKLSCGFTALTQAGLVNYQKQKHGPSSTGQCKLCRQTFSRQSLHNHKPSQHQIFNIATVILACIIPHGMKAAKGRKGVCVCACAILIHMWSICGPQLVSPCSDKSLFLYFLRHPYIFILYSFSTYHEARE